MQSSVSFCMIKSSTVNEATQMQLNTTIRDKTPVSMTKCSTNSIVVVLHTHILSLSRSLLAIKIRDEIQLANDSEIGWPFFCVWQMIILLLFGPAQNKVTIDYSLSRKFVWLLICDTCALTFSFPFKSLSYSHHIHTRTCILYNGLFFLRRTQRLTHTVGDEEEDNRGKKTQQFTLYTNTCAPSNGPQSQQQQQSQQQRLSCTHGLRQFSIECEFTEKKGNEIHTQSEWFCVLWLLLFRLLLSFIFANLFHCACMKDRRNNEQTVEENEKKCAQKIILPSDCFALFVFRVGQFVFAVFMCHCSNRTKWSMKLRQSMR